MSAFETAEITIIELCGKNEADFFTGTIAGFRITNASTDVSTL